MNKITDIFGKTPKVGDIIVYNPPHYKGLVYGKCKALSKAGNPRVEILSDYKEYYIRLDKDGLYSPKTGFVIVNNNNNE